MVVLGKKKARDGFYDSAATVHAGIRSQDMTCKKAGSIRLEKRTHSCFAADIRFSGLRAKYLM